MFDDISVKDLSRFCPFPLPAWSGFQVSIKYHSQLDIEQINAAHFLSIIVQNTAGYKLLSQKQTDYSIGHAGIALFERCGMLKHNFTI